MKGNSGNPPAIAVTPARLDFGSVTLNQPKSLTVAIANSGGSDLNVSSVTTDNRQFTAGVASANIAPGASFNFSLQFTPTAAGAQTGTLTHRK